MDLPEGCPVLCAVRLEAYARKVWTTHERRSAQARALQSTGKYVLPVRFDDTEILGLRPTIAHVGAASKTPAQVAKLISEKLGPRVRERFFPPMPDKLFDALGAQTAEVGHLTTRRPRDAGVTGARTSMLTA